MSWSNEQRLLAVKLLHTVAWAFFVGCIVGIPIYALQDRLAVAAVLCGIVFVESLVVVLSGWHCPLTPVAARYTTDRRANFDIFLPEWLARHNKTIFGALYLLGALLVLYRWLG